MQLLVKGVRGAYQTRAAGRPPGRRRHHHLHGAGVSAATRLLHMRRPGGRVLPCIGIHAGGARLRGAGADMKESWRQRPPPGRRPWVSAGAWVAFGLRW